jgi:hypothetical protein
LGVLFLGTFAAVPAFAGSQNGTWIVNYYSDSGCTTTWPNGSTGGGSGFASTGNLGAGESALLTVGDTVYFMVSVTGGDHSATFYYQQDGGNSPWPGPITLLTTDASGDGTSLCIGFGPVTQAQADAVNCTIDNKVAKGSTSSSAFDGNIIDHFIITGSNQCPANNNFPPPSVPQFPAGIALLVAVALPAMLLLRKRSSLRS